MLRSDPRVPEYTPKYRVSYRRGRTPSSPVPGSQPLAARSDGSISRKPSQFSEYILVYLRYPALEVGSVASADVCYGKLA